MLARTLGRTVAELEHTMSPGELVEWQALWELEPWGETRQELATAFGFSAVCSLWSKEPVPPSDLIPEWDWETVAKRRQKLERARLEAWGK